MRFGRPAAPRYDFSALQRAEIAEIAQRCTSRPRALRFSALQRAEIAEIARSGRRAPVRRLVSVLFNEPKLLKSLTFSRLRKALGSFSALQRAEIAEIPSAYEYDLYLTGFSALQRAEIAEIGVVLPAVFAYATCFSALQRAEIAEIPRCKPRV